MVARALAQQAQILILDEPTNHLDIQHQLQLMDLIQTLHLTVVATLHDLNILCYVCDQIYVLQQGRIVCHGTPEEVLTPTVFARCIWCFADIQIHPMTGSRILHMFLNSSRRGLAKYRKVSSSIRYIKHPLRVTVCK